MSSKKKKHTCLLCGALSRNVSFYALMGGYYHHECWLELGRDNLMQAILRRGSDNPVPAPASEPFGSDVQLGLFGD